MFAYKNCIFVHDQINENISESFNNLFTTAPAQHNYKTRGSPNNTIIKAITNSVTYGLNSLKQRAASDWNGRIKHINTIGIDRQDLMRSLRKRIFDCYTYPKRVSHILKTQSQN